MNLLIDLLNFLQPYGTYSYFLIFAVLLACGFGLPVPEDITLVTAGILAARHIIDFKASIILCMIGVLGGDGIIFTMGSRYGLKIRASRYYRLIVPEHRDQKVKEILEKYGDKVIFMARFMPGLRTPLFFATGSYHVPFWKFLLLDGFAALISVPLWIYVGYLFGANLEELEKVIRRAQAGIYLSLGLLIAAFFVILVLKRRATKFGEAKAAKIAPEIRSDT